jgi:hypothetical protein
VGQKPNGPKACVPRVIPRAEHGISRRQISAGALKVLYRLHRSGYRACLVGGSVRDLLLGRTPKDFDVATSARPSEIRKLFRNCRLIGRRFRLAHILFRGKVIETATFRAAAGEQAPDGDLLILHCVRYRADRERRIQHLNIDDVRQFLQHTRPRYVVLTHFGRTMLQAKPWEVAQALSDEFGIPVRAASDGWKLNLEEVLEQK